MVKAVANPYKITLFNYFVMMGLVPLVIIIIQSGLWPLIVKSLPLYLWVPYLIYWILYRHTIETVVMIYILSFMIASSSSILVSHLLLIHAVMFLTILFFKRVYYTSMKFFSTACGVSLLLFPLLLWVLSVWLEGQFYFPGLLVCLGGGVLSWGLGFPLLFSVQFIDKQTLAIKTTK